MPSTGRSFRSFASYVPALALTACTAAVHPAPKTLAPKHPDGSHYHAFAAALRDGESRSMGRVATSSSYVVKKGDTLYSLARSHAVTVQELAALNGIAKPEALQTGARLRLPVRKHAPLEPAAAPTPVAGSPGPVADATAGAGSHLTPSYMLQWPLKGVITSRFGSRSGHAHDGIDIGAPPGTDVRAAADGEVVFADAHGGYGNVVILRHRHGLLTIYAHHERNLVRKGQEVHAGDPIARVGTTGKATGPHLHFEVRQGTRPQNPMRYLPPGSG